MSRLSLKATVWILATLTVGVWTLFAVEAALTGGPNLMLVATALMFTTMTALVPFLTGWKVSGTHVVQARMCRECHAMRWPTEDVFGFCIRCGSTKLARASGF